MNANDQMREDFRNLETKVDALQTQVAQLPTKADLSGFATKDDLSRFATKDDLVAFKDEILKNFKVLSEDAKESVTKAAEGYGATLERIERDLSVLNRKVDDGLFDHTRILADHSNRLVRLERKRRSS